jgi:hypothetical protein
MVSDGDRLSNDSGITVPNFLLRNVNRMTSAIPFKMLLRESGLEKMKKD